MTAAAGRGSTTIADKAVRKIAEGAAREALPDSMVSRPRGSATVQGRRATVAVRAALPYPAPLSDTARQIQRHVAERTRQLTGLEIPLPRLAVTGLESHQVASVPPANEPQGAGAAQRRWWSARRVPTALLILAVATGCAAVTADVIRVHTTGHAAAPWRAYAVNWLAGHRSGDLGTTVGALVVAAVGVWLLVLALTPGCRRQLTLLTAGGPRESVAIDRSAMASLVKDAVGSVDGVEAVRVRAGRRRFTVRTRLAFGERETALRQATEAAERTLNACLLRRALRCRVFVTPAPTWASPQQAADDEPFAEKGPTA
ncbi:DUF6286 domain-containing protein [Streptomyces sp. NPDC055897]